MDLESVVVFLAGGTQPIVRFIIQVALIVGLIGSVAFLLRARKVAKHSTDVSGMGRIVAGIAFCCCLISLRQFMNSGAHTLGYGDVSFDAVTYASQSTFGLGATVVNAILTILRAVGAYFFYRGVKGLKDSQLEGNTELSASGLIGKSITQMVCGLLLIFNPEVMDSFLTAIN